MFTKKISVIIPAYNIENLIEKCLDSVMGQTYPKNLMEVIVVDDGSTDGTYAKLEGYYEKHKDDGIKLRVLHQDNGGSSSARNYGLSVASGDYIGFVDADDYVDMHMYETLMSAIENNGNGEVMMAQASRDEIAESGEKLPDVCIPPHDTIVVSGAEHLRTLLMHTGDASYCTKLTKKELFMGEEGKFPVGELNEDFYLMIHMLCKVDKIAIIPQQYYHVFYRSGSNSRKKKEQKDYFPPVFTDIVRNSDVAFGLVQSRFPELREVSVRFCLVQRLDYLLHIPISQMNSGNSFYKYDVVRYLRKHIGDTFGNRYLTKRDRIYLILLTIAPRFVRQIHAKIRGIDNENM